MRCIDELAAAFERAEQHQGGAYEHAQVYRDSVLTAMARLRVEADHLETLTDDAYWPLPKYRELLFLH